MKRFFLPIVIVAAGSLLGALFLLLFIPPVHPLIIAALLLLIFLALASLATLGIYYLRRFWGPKDSPRYLLRLSMRQAVIYSTGVTIFLFLQLLGAINPVSLIFLIGLTVAIERLT